MKIQVTKLEHELLEKILLTDCAGYIGAYTEYAYALDIDMDIKKVTGLMMSLKNKDIIYLEDINDGQLESALIVIKDYFLNEVEEEYSLRNIKL